MSEKRPFPALCAWVENGPDESWLLQVELPTAFIPAEAAAGDEQEIFVDLNGVTDRRKVPGGIMTRRPARDEGGDRADGADATRYSIELPVPRGYRGGASLPAGATRTPNCRPSDLARCPRTGVPPRR